VSRVIVLNFLISIDQQCYKYLLDWGRCKKKAPNGCSFIL